MQPEVPHSLGWQEKDAVPTHPNKPQAGLGPEAWHGALLQLLTSGLVSRTLMLQEVHSPFGWQAQDALPQVSRQLAQLKRACRAESAGAHHNQQLLKLLGWLELLVAELEESNTGARPL